ncbi:MAG: excinuclease ABC subunit UvrC [Dehalococcoidales bacterium]|nr:excinuclease ABC subunit UvrC [Dehalococcoidales bacterium]
MTIADAHIEAQVNRLPHKPGVYLMKDAGKAIIYVGKAVDLYNRVRSYFQSPHQHTPKTQRMISRIADIDYFIATSEQEALILELNLIKQHRPQYNVCLKDDKTFPYIKVAVNEEWPRVYSTRRFEQDGGRYFGPFASSKSVKHTLKVLKNIFPYRTCSKTLDGKAPRPCLEFHMGRCLSPCTGDAARKEYDQVVKEVILFLEGKREAIVNELKSRMSNAAEATDYEKAAALRDQVQAIENVIEGEKIAAVIRGDEDVIAFVQDGDRAYVQVMFVRDNKMTGREGFLLQGARQEEPVQIITSFIKQYYSSSQQVPPLLLIQYPVEEKQVLKEWLKDRRGAGVNIEVPRRGVKKQLIDISAENARQGLEQLKIKEMTSSVKLEDALAEIAEELKLDAPPNRIEAYDISNIQGSNAVGSMVVFEKGKPRPAHYRRFKIKTVEGPNDYAMLQEVLRRRFKHAGKSTSETDTWAIQPDLILIDGGKGQLNAALAALKESGTSVPTIGLAKENEEIFLPRRKDPVILPRSSAGLHLLQRLRDEAHRFAISYYGKLHRRQTFASSLDAVPGIGPRRKSSLVRQFGSVKRIREATVDELVAATGMPREQAMKIKEYL